MPRSKGAGGKGAKQKMQMSDIVGKEAEEAEEQGMYWTARDPGEWRDKPVDEALLKQIQMDTPTKDEELKKRQAQKQQAAMMQKQADGMRAAMMQKILSPEALERMQKIKIGSLNNARMVQDHLIETAKAGQILSQVTEEELKEVVAEVIPQSRSAHGSDGSAINFRRRKSLLDDLGKDFHFAKTLGLNTTGWNEEWFDSAPESSTDTDEDYLVGDLAEGQESKEEEAGEDPYE